MGAIIKDLKLTETGGSSSEVVTVQDVKDYLQIEGTAYDGPLAIFITAARQLVEKIGGVSLMEKTAILTINQQSTKFPFKLPGFPVDSVTTVAWRRCPSTWVEQVLDEDYYLIGEDSISIQGNHCGYYKVTYELGVDGQQIWVQAIQAQAAFMFNNRDAKPGEVAPEVQALLMPVYEIA